MVKVLWEREVRGENLLVLAGHVGVVGSHGCHPSREEQDGRWGFVLKASLRPFKEREDT